MRNDELTERVIGAAITVHRALGPGLLESVYQQCLAHELRKQGMLVQTEVPVRIEYDGLEMEAGFRIDIMVEGELILELKTVEDVLPIHKAQLITYLKLAGISRGLLLNFNVELMKDGIHRLYAELATPLHPSLPH